MRYFIITALVALAAVKAKSQAKDKLGNQRVRKNQEARKQIEGTREVADKSTIK